MNDIAGIAQKNDTKYHKDPYLQQKIVCGIYWLLLSINESTSNTLNHDGKSKLFKVYTTHLCNVYVDLSRICKLK